MESIFEGLFEMILYVICIVPGAFFRWIFLFRKYSFKEILKQDSYMNGSIGFLGVGIIISVILLIRQI